MIMKLKNLFKKVVQRIYCAYFIAGHSNCQSYFLTKWVGFGGRKNKK